LLRCTDQAADEMEGAVANRKRRGRTPWVQISVHRICVADCHRILTSRVVLAVTAPYQFEMAITTNSVETKYPDLDCTGKLTRVGSAKSYVYFFEVITKGRADKGGRCPDGTITVAPQGKDLAVGWFGNVQDTTVVAYGTLNKK
jgi:hypothetical protein